MILKQQGKEEYAFLVTTAGVVTVFLMLIGYIDELLEMMMRHELKPYFISSAEKSGLSARVINKVFQDKDEKFVENVKQALQRYSERQVVLRTQNMPYLGEKEWKLFLKDMESCEEVTLESWAKKPWYHKLLQSVIRLFAPLL